MPRNIYPLVALAAALALATTAGCNRNDNGDNGAAPAASTAVPMTPPAAATTPTPAPAGSAPMTGAMAPGAFVAEASTDGMEEVALANLALDKTANADVKSFAQEMKDEHTKANIKLASIASADAIDVPTAMTADQQAAVDGLKARSGADFDAAYADLMVTAHQNAVALFESAATGASTPELRQFASDTLPTLRTHLQMAQALQSGLSGGAGDGDAMGERFGAL
jgi:putative membrane protein